MSLSDRGLWSSPVCHKQAVKKGLYRWKETDVPHRAMVTVKGQNDEPRDFRWDRRMAADCLFLFFPLILYKKWMKMTWDQNEKELMQKIETSETVKTQFEYDHMPCMLRKSLTFWKWGAMLSHKVMVNLKAEGPSFWLWSLKKMWLSPQNKTFKQWYMSLEEPSINFPCQVRWSCHIPGTLSGTKWNNADIMVHCNN